MNHIHANMTSNHSAHSVETCGLSLWGWFFFLLLWSLVKYTDIKPHHAYILTYSFNTPQQHNFPRLCLLLYTFCLPFYHRWWKFPYLKPFLFQQSTSRQYSSPVFPESYCPYSHIHAYFILATSSSSSWRDAHAKEEHWVANKLFPDHWSTSNKVYMTCKYT